MTTTFVGIEKVAQATLAEAKVGGADGIEFGLPHPLSRPGQREAVEWLGERENGETVVLSAPTGSGKTSFAAALAHEHKTIALVKTKSLQVENYGEGYEFDVMYGRSNYPCVNGEAMPGTTAAECLFDSAMHDCPAADDCTYLGSKRRAMRSKKTSLNYAYWLTSRWPRERLGEAAENKKAYLFLDEAHQLSDIVLDWTSCTVTMKDRIKWGLESFPTLYGRANADDTGQAAAWLSDSMELVARVLLPLEHKKLEYMDGQKKEFLLSPDETRALTSGNRLYLKLKNAHIALLEHSDDWYIRSGANALDNYGTPQPGFVARPLTARYHFGGLFLSDWTTVAMSATIGDPKVFADELGIERYAYRDIPNQFAAAQRPVRVLDAPAMGQKNRYDESAQMQQAKVIADAINECPRDWGGIIHVTRKSEASELAARLERLGVRGRIWTPKPTDSTDWALREWNNFKRRTTGAIAITWAWWEGYNGLDEKICIVAKTPFPNLADEYERARMAYSGTMFLQRTAWNLEQALGRTRRGRAEVDYDTEDEKRGLVAIADMNFTRCQAYMSTSLREALVH